MGEGLASNVKFIIKSLLIFLFILVITYYFVTIQYKKEVVATIDGNIIGYYNNQSEFDDVYNKLHDELSLGYNEYDIYLEKEPSFEFRYIKKDSLINYNNYDLLRSYIKTDYYSYVLYANNESKITFLTLQEASTYYDNIKSETENLNLEIKKTKTESQNQITNIERADSIRDELVSRYKPVVIPEPEVPKTCYPTITRYISCYYMGYYGHTGIDLAGKLNDPIYSYKSGYIESAGFMGAYGNCIIVNHQDGTKTRYAHLNKIFVKNGQLVDCGFNIGLMGTTGNSTGVHLHFEMIINNKTVDPYPYIY